MRSLLLLLFLAPLPAFAGDPCGGSIAFVDIGVPTYADRPAQIASDPVADPQLFGPLVDPLAAALSAYLGRQNEACFHYEYDYTPERAQALRASLMDGQNRFRCHDAHIALGHLRTLETFRRIQVDGQSDELDYRYAHTHEPEVVYMRGSRRLILAMPYWGARCYDLADLATPAGLQAVADDFGERVTGLFVEERRRNP